MPEEQKVTVVEAVAVAAGRGTGQQKSTYSLELEQYMSAVIQKCYDEGLADKPDVIRERMAVARSTFKARFAQRK